MTSLAEIWPPFGLRVECGPLDLQVIRDDDIPALIELVNRGVHGDVMPFSTPWTTVPPAILPANYARFVWTQRASQVADNVGLEFVVRHEGVVCGIQGFTGSRFAARRAGETGSWLGLEFQGRGIGTLMRQTICAFAFEHLGAEWITSAAFTDNPASNEVSRKVGYQPNGVERVFRGEEWQLNAKYLLTPETFVPPPYPLKVSGLQPYLAFAGLA